LRPGLYLSPWDRNNPAYGDSPRYNDLYCDQLSELLTHYGKISEVWFDGANGEGPNGKHQVYDWPRYWGLVRRLQPEAVIFSDAGPDIRWIGNERGVAGETNWSTVDPSIVPRPGMSGDEVMRSLTEGDRDGSVWRPGETDTSIRPGWFWHPAEDGKQRSVADLVELYATAVGRNSKLLLNVPPTREGLMHDTDVARLAAMHRGLVALRAEPRHRGNTSWHSTGPESAIASVELAPEPVATIELSEQIESGQRVARHVVEGRTAGGWRELAHGTTIGYKRIHQIAPATVEALRVRIEESADLPLPIAVRAYGPA
jgi:alpha-L-fucosidase